MVTSFDGKLLSTSLIDDEGLVEERVESSPLSSVDSCLTEFLVLSVYS